MPRPLTGEQLLNHLMKYDSYDAAVRRFNGLTHAEKFEALEDRVFRGYLSRATEYSGSITAGKVTA